VNLILAIFQAVSYFMRVVALEYRWAALLLASTVSGANVAVQAGQDIKV
jgi:hypothetical protein